jgi:hypothetical protein
MERGITYRLIAGTANYPRNPTAVLSANYTIIVIIGRFVRHISGVENRVAFVTVAATTCRFVGYVGSVNNRVAGVAVAADVEVRAIAAGRYTANTVARESVRALRHNRVAGVTVAANEDVRAIAASRYTASTVARESVRTLRHRLVVTQAVAVIAYAVSGVRA